MCIEVLFSLCWRDVSDGSEQPLKLTCPAPSDILWFSREDVDCWGISYYPFTAESGFEKSEPCAIRMITKRDPEAQSAWRVDFENDGYRAFLRPAVDNMRELELGFYCDENVPGRLFLGMDIAGPREVLQGAITNVSIEARPVLRRNAGFGVFQVDPAHSRVVTSFSGDDVLNLLTRSEYLSFTISVRPPYETIWAGTHMAGSRSEVSSMR